MNILSFFCSREICLLASSYTERTFVPKLNSHLTPVLPVVVVLTAKACNDVCVVELFFVHGDVWRFVSESPRFG